MALIVLPESNSVGIDNCPILTKMKGNLLRTDVSVKTEGGAVSLFIYYFFIGIYIRLPRNWVGLHIAVGSYLRIAFAA